MGYCASWSSDVCTMKVGHIRWYPPPIIPPSWVDAPLHIHYLFTKYRLYKITYTVSINFYGSYLVFFFFLFFLLFHTSVCHFRSHPWDTVRWPHLASSQNVIFIYSYNQLTYPPSRKLYNPKKGISNTIRWFIIKTLYNCCENSLFKINHRKWWKILKLVSRAERD